MRKLLTNLLLAATLFTLFGCAASPESKVAGDGVLVPASAETPAAAVATSPHYEKLMALLTSLGYEGVGLQFESDEVLALLVDVFSQPKAKNRQLKMVYTGYDMSYDAAAKSLTIGKLKSSAEIISFLQKNVPLNR